MGLRDAAAPGRETEGRALTEACGPLPSMTDSLSVRPTPISVLLRAEITKLLTRVDTAEAIRRRAVQEALSAATAHTWRRRSDLLEWARPRPGEWVGQSTPVQLAERDRRLAAQAEACRHRAELLELGLLDFEVVSDVR